MCQAFESGVDLATVQKMAGHASVSTTGRYDRRGHGPQRTAAGQLHVPYVPHGAVKIVLVAALLRNKLWAYPWMIGFLLIFIVYQIYRMIWVPSAGLAALTAFDIFVVWLTYREYGKQRSLRAAPRAFRVLR